MTAEAAFVMGDEPDYAPTFGYAEPDEPAPTDPPPPADETPPVLTVLSTPASRFGFLTFSVIDDHALALIVFAVGGRVAFDNAIFRDGFTGTVVEIPGGYRFEVVPVAGWSPGSVVVDAWIADTSGNVAT